MYFKKSKVAKAVGGIFSLSLSLGVPVSEAAVIDLDQFSGNEIVLTEDSSLLQSALPTIAGGDTFSVKGKYTLTIGPAADVWQIVSTNANVKLNIEGSLLLLADKDNPVSGGIHTNNGTVIDVGKDLTISGGFKFSGNAIQLVGVRSNDTDEASRLKVGNTILIHDSTFSGSNPFAIQLMNSDIESKNLKFENIKRTSTSNGPFYLLGLMGNSSKVRSDNVDIVEVESDTGFLAIAIDSSDSALNVGNVNIENLKAKNGSYLTYSAGISSSGSVTATNEIRISNLESNTDDLFAVYAEGEKDTGQTYLSSLQTETLTIKNVKSLEKSAVGILSDLGKFNIKSIAIDGVSAKVDAVGVVLSNISHDSDFGHIKISNISGGVSSSGLQADNLTLSNGLEISNITSESGNAAAIVAMPVHEDDPGLVVNTTPGIANVIEGDLLTLSHSTDQTKGKLTASFDGQASSLTGATFTQMDETSDQGTINLAFKNKAKWTVTKNSTLTSLNMDKGVLSVDINLTDGAQDGTTQVDVQGEAKGTFDVALNITGQAGADFTKSEDWFLQQTSGVLSVGDVTYQNGGALAYSVAFFEDGAALDAEGSSTSTGNKGQWHVVLAPEDPGEPDVPPVTPEVEQVLALGASVNQGLGMLSETEDLRMRMGDIRNGDTDGLWVRTYARKDSAHGSFGNGFEQDTYGIHLGADHVVKAGNDASWLFGGAFHYGQSDMDGTADAAGGSADVDQYTFKAYATYMKDNGAFVDLVLHAGYYDTELTGLANNKMAGFKADYSNWGYGISAEAGHRFEFGETASAWYVEPTAQLTWFHAEGKDFTTSTGLAVSQGDADFITGRLGAAMGKTFALGTDSDPMASYFSVGLKGGMLYQFDGDQTITAHGTDGATVHCDAMDLKGARAYYGLTADWKIDDAWRVYGQISREEGSGYTKDYDASIGVRYAF